MIRRHARNSFSCATIVILSLAVALPLTTEPQVAIAGDTIRLVLDGRIDIEELIDPGVTNEELNLHDGDPIQFLFEFDQEFQGAPAFESVLDRYEVQIKGHQFSRDDDLTGSRAFLSQAGASGLQLDVLSSDFLSGRVNDIDLKFSIFTAAPNVVSFTTSDIGADPSLFPADLMLSDLASTFPGTFVLSTDPFDGLTSNLLTYEIVGLSVEVIPEPATAALVLIGCSGALMASRRRR